MIGNSFILVDQPASGEGLDKSLGAAGKPHNLSSPSEVEMRLLWAGNPLYFTLEPGAGWMQGRVGPR
jgi:hypothetical protein